MQTRESFHIAATRFSLGPYAFTLIELMVVLAVVTILASLLLPAFSKARRTAQSIQCLNNTRQLTVAIFLYGDDNAGHLPARTRISPWFERIEPYHQTPGLLTCPTEERVSRRSYALNGFSDWFETELTPFEFLAFQLWMWPEGFPLAAANQPSETLLFGEKLKNSETVHVDTFQDGGNHIYEIDQARHTAYSNFSFLDGSARKLEPFRSLRPHNLWLVNKNDFP
jgi:prepilin-type N-terminal cleavage/methylation domain-containing protein/prepilin-type processing-associated H-X9-DG protein